MSEKINFLLDLDQTCIFSVDSASYDAKQNNKKAMKFKFHDMANYYIVFERPGLQPFLSYLFKNFNVSIWTAASKEYASFVIDKVILAGDGNRKLDYVFFQYHTKLSKKIKKNIKDLNILWDTFGISNYSKENTIILDDLDDVYNPQKSNCIFCPIFDFNNKDSENDKFLPFLEKELKTIKSVQDSVVEINKKIQANFVVNV